MADLQITRYKAIASAPNGTWRSAIQDRLCSSPEWLAMLEANNFALARRYSIASSPNRPDRGALSSFLVDEQVPADFHPLGLLTADEMVQPWLRRLSARERTGAGRAIARLAQAPIARAAVSVAPFGYEHALLARDAEATSALIAELEQAGAAWDCPTTAVLYVDWRDRNLRRALTHAGYAGWISGARCELPVTWPSMDAYITSMKSHRRISIRHEMNQFARAGIAVSLDTPPADTLAFARLSALHQQKHGNGYDPEFENMVLQNYRKFLKSKCQLVVGRRNGEPVGYEVICVDRNRWRAGMCGWDETKVAPEEYAYFNLAYYCLIDLAIQHGVKVIDYGLTAYRAKLNRGCVLHPLWSYIKVPDDYRSRAQTACSSHTAGMHELLNRMSADSRAEGADTPFGGDAT